MRRIVLILTALSLAAVAGCARGPSPTIASIPTDWSAGADDGMSWHYLQAEDGPKLAYGVANSDAVRLMVYCQGQGRLRLETTSAIPAGRFRLTSGQRYADLGASSEPNPMGGGHLVTTTIGSDSTALRPTVQEFRQTGRLNLEVGGVSSPLHAGEGERAAVEQFFSACG